ncbi:MAG TPA: helix-turn-helix transcriptional regulator [Vicinamibacterales bacterium]
MDMSEAMKPAVLHILLALADGDRHGYAIMQAVREQSGGAVPLRTGTFYRHLAALIDAGWIAEAAGPRGDDPRRGAYYRLTARGRDALRAERTRLVELLAAFPSGRAIRKSHS